MKINKTSVIIGVIVGLITIATFSTNIVGKVDNRWAKTTALEVVRETADLTLVMFREERALNKKYKTQQRMYDIEDLYGGSTDVRIMNDTDKKRYRQLQQEMDDIERELNKLKGDDNG